jgi:hypothetical protein
MSSTADLPAMMDRRYQWGLILIILLACAARFINLGGDSLWADEIFTLQDSRQSLDRIFAGEEIDHPFGYFLVEHFALDIWGTSEYALRLASALAGTLTIPLIYVIGSLLAGRRTGLWAAGLLAFAPFHIRYSQEARGYAIQVALVAAGTACILLALKHRRYRWWVGFGITAALSVYILYSSFAVLAGLVVFVVVLTAIQWLARRWTLRRALEVAAGLTVGGVVALVAYSPWISHAVHGTAANIGPAQSYLAMWVGVPLSDWLSGGYFAFGYMTDALAAVTALLSAIGLGYGVLRRRIDFVMWLLIGTIVPLLLITLVGVSRAPLPKYILFVMLVYLVAAAAGLDTLVQALSRAVNRLNPFAARRVPLVVAAGLLVIGIPLVRAEHDYVYNDWKGIAQYLKQAAQPGDVVVPMTLDLASAFNQGYVGLSYYLPKIAPDLQLMEGESLVDPRVSDLNAAARSQGDVWFTVLNRSQPVQFDDPAIQVLPFQGSIYLVHAPAVSPSPLGTMVMLYEKIIPQAMTPSPQCYLWLDLARLQIELQRYSEARAAVSNFRTPCPDSLGIRQALYRFLLDHYLQTQQTDQVRAIAQQLLIWNAKDKSALAALTVYDLNALFAAKAPIVTTVPSPAKPIEIQRFTMPHNGDWGDALVMQTPATLSIRLNLPPEQTRFVSRVAMAPESWAWGGDGSRFKLSVQLADGGRSTVFDQYVSNTLSDQDWHAVDVSLAAYAGQTITLTLETDAGPNGDTTGDWAGWDSPRVVYATTGTP